MAFISISGERATAPYVVTSSGIKAHIPKGDRYTEYKKGDRILHKI